MCYQDLINGHTKEEACFFRLYQKLVCWKTFETWNPRSGSGKGGRNRSKAKLSKG